MSHGYQNRRICAVQAFCAAKSWRRWDSLPPSILITLGLSRLRRVKQKTRRVARHKRFRCAKTLVHKQFICLCAVKCPTDTKKKSTALRCSSFWQGVTIPNPGSIKALRRNGYKTRSHLAHRFSGLFHYKIMPEPIWQKQIGIKTYESASSPDGATFPSIISTTI